MFDEIVCSVKASDSDSQADPDPHENGIEFEITKWKIEN